MSTEQELFEDDKIIELVDVVRKGDKDKLVPDDLGLLLDEDEISEKDMFIEESAGGDSFELSDALEEAPEQDLESNLHERDAIPDDVFDSPDFDFELPEDLGEPVTDTLPELPRNESTEMTAAPEGEVEPEKPEPAATAAEQLPISPERLEGIITEAVREVVERVTRETVAEVSEKVIKEAIESLKQSLEPRPE
ncbi:MAG: hypothetical protein ABIE47_10440 [Pseudomonadota bacterium]|nr:hypothetical protein [Pseudomonadota bacterium]